MHEHARGVRRDEAGAARATARPMHTTPPSASSATMVTAAGGRHGRAARPSRAPRRRRRRWSSTWRPARAPARRSGGPSSRWPRMFSSTATPAFETPILPTMPASVSVSTRRPSGWSIVHTIQPSRSSSCQSHVCDAQRAAVAVAVPRQAMVEHSPRPASDARCGRSARRPARQVDSASGGDALDLVAQVGTSAAIRSQRLRRRGRSTSAGREPITLRTALVRGQRGVRCARPARGPGRYPRSPGVDSVEWCRGSLARYRAVHRTPCAMPDADRSRRRRHVH